MSIEKLKLVVHTVKYLRFQQIYFRIYYAVRNRFFKRDYSKKLREAITPLIWSDAVLSSNSYLGKNTFNFLNIQHSFDAEIDWNYNAYGKLWTYNLNYFDFLNQQEITSEEGVQLIHSYIKAHASLKDGYEPYPISLRGVNWIQFLSKHKIVDPLINQSLYNQYQVLLNNLEYHLLGNHLLENGFSLFFAAYYFKDDQFYKKAKTLLNKELTEEILNDGAHFELSPMYHKILLKKLLDCIHLTQQNKWNKTYSLDSFLKEKAVKMVSWLKEITFKDGSIPMVNDSAHEIALTSKQLFGYANELAISVSKIKLSDSGYRKFTSDTHELFMDVGQVGPSYQPGHAHADTFSFVLHNQNKPLLVDPGVSTYEICPTREKERSTGYHNTVTVHHSNSSQVWSGFRVAQRANVTILVDDEFTVSAKHDGFRKYGIEHTRTFAMNKEGITINDTLNSKESAKAYFHLHPNCEVEFLSGKNAIFVDANELRFKGSESVVIETYAYALGFNSTVKAKKIVVTFRQTLTTSIKNS